MDFPNFGSCCQWNTVTPSKRCGCKLVCMSERGRWERSEEEEEEEEEEDEEEHFNVLVKKLVANPSPLWHSHHRWRQLAISPCSTLCSFLANWQPSVPSVRAESGKGEKQRVAKERETAEENETCIVSGQSPDIWGCACVMCRPSVVG